MEVKPARDEGRDETEIALECLFPYLSNVLSAGNHYPLMFWAIQIMGSQAGDLEALARDLEGGKAIYTQGFGRFKGGRELNGRSLRI